MFKYQYETMLCSFQEYTGVQINPWRNQKGIYTHEYKTHKNTLQWVANRIRAGVSKLCLKGPDKYFTLCRPLGLMATIQLCLCNSKAATQ